MLRIRKAGWFGTGRADRAAWGVLVGVILALAALGAARNAAACIGSDGTIPPWKGSGANPLMANKIQSMHAFAKANKMAAPLSAPVSGTHKVVLILVENRDNGAMFESAYRSAGLWNNRIKEFDAYYNEVSRGKLRIAAAAESHGTSNDGVIGPIKVSNLGGGSSIDWTNSKGIVAQAVKAANPYINFASFDRNGDRVLTADELHIGIYQAGDEQSFSPSSLPRAWAHMMYFGGGLSGTTPSSDSDGMKLTSYVYCGSELGGTRMATMGQMTHELGHDLGLPDLYDTDTQDWRGLGYHCLMASGSWGGDLGTRPVHLDGFFKSWLGWANVTRANAPANLDFSLPAANGSNRVVQLDVPGSDEFFIIENRQQTGFDAGLPGDAGGLAIYHCDHGKLQDQTVTSYITDSDNGINSDRLDFGIKLEEADGDDALGRMTSNKGIDLDYFRGGNKTAFNATSTPNSKLKNGGTTNISISGVGASAASMSFTVGTPPPVLRTFSINGGAASTASRNVTLNSLCSGNPTHYMASESSTFSGAAWVAYTAAASFKIASAGNGTKTIYFKVKNASSVVSGWMSDSIVLNEPPPALTSFRINNGAGTAYSRMVTLNNTWSGGTPTRYMASESPAFAGAGWMVWSAAPGFTLSAGNGTKTVYLKLKHASNVVSNVMVDTIVLNEQPVPVVTRFQIGNGAASIAARTVSLNNTCAGIPTHFMASESSSFAGAAWVAWTAAPSFRIASAGNGTKKVYFKVKNALGQVSAVVSDTIILNEVASLGVGGAKVSGSIAAGDYDIYQFTAPATGWYTITTEAGTLKDAYMFLMTSGWSKLAEADDQGDNGMPMISTYLAAGIYLVEIDGATDSAAGTYSISLRSGVAYTYLGLDGGWANGNIATGQEVDWYRFTVATRGTVTIETMDGALTDGKMFLYKMGAVAPLAMNDDQVDYYNSTYYYPTMPVLSTVLEPGTYVLAVQGYSSLDTGSYTIRVRKGNSDVTCMTLYPNGPAVGWQVSSTFPNNFYQFRVETAGTYTLKTTAGSMNDAEMVLYRLTLDPDLQYVQTEVASNLDASTTNFMPQITMALSPGTYLVWVGAEYLPYGNYSITLTR